MARIEFTGPEEITDEQLEYMLGEAMALSQQDDLQIENYADREAFNPDVDEIPVDDIADDLADEEPLVIGFLGLHRGRLSRKRKFRKIKRKVRQIFCQVVSDLGGGEELNLKDLLKNSLIAIIPAFGGLHAVVSAIVLSFLAVLIKRGYKRICPV